MTGNLRILAAALVCGAVFGGGLALSGMTNPARVLGFLDVTGDWDPTLAFVMGGALLVTTPVFQALRKRRRTPLGQDVILPTRQTLDRRLFGGAVLFGIGWGLVGLCPGPAVAALAIAPRDVALFTLSLIVGIVVHDRIVGPLFAKETSS